MTMSGAPHKPSPARGEIDELIERLRKVQALHDAPATEGERAAAAAAAERLKQRLSEAQRSSAESKEIEFQMRIDDAWSRKLFIGIARHHGVRPYRYPGQRRTTLVVRTTKRHLDERIMPHYRDAVAVLRTHFDEIADRVIRESLHVSTDDTEERRELRA
jgi:hypothetical protein